MKFVVSCRKTVPVFHRKHMLYITRKTVVYITCVFKIRFSLLLWIASWPRFDHATRNNVIGRLQVGQCHTKFAWQFNVNQSLEEIKSNRISSRWGQKWFVATHYSNSHCFNHCCWYPALRRISTHKVLNMLRHYYSA